VTKILNRFENRIRIDGAVFRPNTYSFYEGMRISDLIAKAEGLKEDV
jgi:protein involved in polysaccharide export with SLBB domain